MKRAVLAMIGLYQLTLRRVLPPRCRFFPSCSDYAADAVARRGVLGGGAAALGRLLRCHPFNSGGYDPVVHHG